MACRRYENQLTDAALGILPADAERKIRAHLTECTACRASYEREARLVAAIDQGVAAGLREEPSAYFQARVRARLEEVPVSGWKPSLVWASAVAMVLLVVAVRIGWQERTTSDSEPSRENMAMVAGPVIVSQGEPAEEKARPPRAISRRTPTSSVEAAPGHEQPEIIVPPGQWAAIAQLTAGLERGTIDGAALVSRGPDSLRDSIRPVVIPALEIPPLEPPEGTPRPNSFSVPGRSEPQEKHSAVAGF